MNGAEYMKELLHDDDVREEGREAFYARRPKFNLNNIKNQQERTLTGAFFLCLRAMGAL